MIKSRNDLPRTSGSTCSDPDLGAKSHVSITFTASVKQNCQVNLKSSNVGQSYTAGTNYGHK